jgi:uncharacterized Zn-finger protein
MKRTELLAHKRWHDKEGRYVCKVPDCEMRFKHRSTLSNHMKTHTGERPYKCDVCKKSFFRSDNLKQHQRIHIREVSFTEERNVRM